MTTAVRPPLRSLTVKCGSDRRPLTIRSPIDENGAAILTGTYTDVGTQDTHELDIDWDGDGVFDQTVVVTGGAFTVTRQFLDDNPTGTPSDTVQCERAFAQTTTGASPRVPSMR